MPVWLPDLPGTKSTSRSETQAREAGDFDYYEEEYEEYPEDGYDEGEYAGENYEDGEYPEEGYGEDSGYPEDGYEESGEEQPLE